MRVLMKPWVPESATKGFNAPVPGWTDGSARRPPELMRVEPLGTSRPSRRDRLLERRLPS